VLSIIAQEPHKKGFIEGKFGLDVSAREVVVEESVFKEILPVSVIIPSFRGSDRLVKLVRDLLSNNYPRLEVVVAIDEPSESIVKEVSRLKSSNVKFILNSERVGKVNALNKAIKVSAGEILIFLDDDVEIADPFFVERVVEEMRNYDIADIRKVIVAENLLGKMIYIEYTAVNFASKLMARLAQRTVAVNGAAFAIKRKALEELGLFRPIISEDFDLAIRSFLRGHRYGYIETTYVLNYPPESLRKWFKQRKRWAVGVADWLEKYYKVGFEALVKMPHVIIPGLILSLPSIVSSVLPFFLYNYTILKGFYLLLLYMSSLVSQVIPFATLISVNLQVVYLIPLMVTLGFFTLWHYIASKYVGMKSYVYLYPVYFLVYQPLWFTILLAGLIRVVVLGRKDLQDWVV
jgi:cellulose synthase/poly-beta-1,6-N-acetylglucosamine synthase-like glycosyltransferase